MDSVYSHFYNYPTIAPINSPKVAFIARLYPNVDGLNDYWISLGRSYQRPQLNIIDMRQDPNLILGPKDLEVGTLECALDLKILMTNCPPNTIITCYVINLYNNISEFQTLEFCGMIQQAIDDGQHIVSFSFGPSELDGFTKIRLKDIYYCHKYFKLACENNLVFVTSGGDGGTDEADQNIYIAKYISNFYTLRILNQDFPASGNIFTITIVTGQLSVDVPYTYNNHEITIDCTNFTDNINNPGALHVNYANSAIYGDLMFIDSSTPTDITSVPSQTINKTFLNIQNNSDYT